MEAYKPDTWEAKRSSAELSPEAQDLERRISDVKFRPLGRLVDTELVIDDIKVRLILSESEVEQGKYVLESLDIDDTPLRQTDMEIFWDEYGGATSEIIYREKSLNAAYAVDRNAAEEEKNIREDDTTYAAAQRKLEIISRNQ